MVLSSLLRAIVGLHPVRLVNADWAPGNRQPSDRANELGLLLDLQDRQTDGQADTVPLHIRSLLEAASVNRRLTGRNLKHARLLA